TESPDEEEVSFLSLHVAVLEPNSHEIVKCPGGHIRTSAKDHMGWAQTDQSTPRKLQW
ncbi:hypothetical protein P7K49_011392, partial [Saguinus oedipus]